VMIIEDPERLAMRSAHEVWQPEISYCQSLLFACEAQYRQVNLMIDSVAYIDASTTGAVCPDTYYL